MASVYGIVKGHGGYIDVVSEKGHGSTFSIYLPACKERPSEEKAGDRQPLEGRGTVFLVDDEEDILEVSIKFLEKLGYTVLKAKGGKEAVQLYEARKDQINLVILDMVMPDLGGGEVYDRIKGINPQVRVSSFQRI